MDISMQNFDDATAAHAHIFGLDHHQNAPRGARSLTRIPLLSVMQEFLGNSNYSRGAAQLHHLDGTPVPRSGRPHTEELVHQNIFSFMNQNHLGGGGGGRGQVMFGSGIRMIGLNDHIRRHNNPFFSSEARFGNFGEFAFGQNSQLQDIMNLSLMRAAEQKDSGPPPAPQSDMDALADIELDSKLIKDNDLGECPICQDDFALGDVTKKLDCDHYFHSDCVLTWLKLHNTCPVCRCPLQEHQQREMTQKTTTTTSSTTSTSTPSTSTTTVTATVFTSETTPTTTSIETCEKRLFNREEELKVESGRTLKNILERRNVDTRGFSEKREFVNAILNSDHLNHHTHQTRGEKETRKEGTHTPAAATDISFREQDLKTSSVRNLKKILRRRERDGYSVDMTRFVEKTDLIQAILESDNNNHHHHHANNNNNNNNRIQSLSTMCVMQTDSTQQEQQQQQEEEEEEEEAGGGCLAPSHIFEIGGEHVLNAQATSVVTEEGEDTKLDQTQNEQNLRKRQHGRGEDEEDKREQQIKKRIKPTTVINLEHKTHAKQKSKKEQHGKRQNVKNDKEKKEHGVRKKMKIILRENDSKESNKSSSSLSSSLSSLSLGGTSPAASAQRFSKLELMKNGDWVTYASRDQNGELQPQLAQIMKIYHDDPLGKYFDIKLPNGNIRQTIQSRLSKTIHNQQSRSPSRSLNLGAYSDASHHDHHHHQHHDHDRHHAKSSSLHNFTMMQNQEPDGVHQSSSPVISSSASSSSSSSLSLSSP